VLIAFVNEVAAAVEKDYPDKLIDAIAYGETEAPPKGMWRLPYFMYSLRAGAAALRETDVAEDRHQSEVIRVANVVERPHPSPVCPGR